MILVSGGTGLVGAHLLYALTKEGNKVRALKRKNSDFSNLKKVFSFYTSNVQDLINSIEWVEGDVLDVLSLSEAMKGIQHVYHCAALVSFNPDDAEEMMKVNVEGTANMVNAALENRVEKFCYMSSIAALGNAENCELINEQTFWAFSPDLSDYSISKYGAEREVWRACQEGLKVIVVNPSLILGAGVDKQSSASVFYNAQKGLLFYTEGGTGCVDVQDVVRLMLQLMKSKIENERFIINSENISYRKLFDLIHIAFGKPKAKIKIARWLTAILWRVEKWRSAILRTTPVITKDTITAAHKTCLYSNQKILQTFSDFRFTPVQQSIEDYSKFFICLQ